MLEPDDIWAPGILDEEREHRNRWAEGRHESHFYDEPTDEEWAEYQDWIARNDGRRIDQMPDEEDEDYDDPVEELAGFSDDCPF